MLTITDRQGVRLSLSSWEINREGVNHVRFASAAMLLCFLSTAGWAQAPAPAPAPAPPPTPYTHAYEVRKDIHKYASYATLPLFAGEYALGESLHEPGESSSTRGL